MNRCGGRKVRGERVMGKGGLKFKELRVWQKSKELAVYVYQIINNVKLNLNKSA